MNYQLFTSALETRKEKTIEEYTAYYSKMEGEIKNRLNCVPVKHLLKPYFYTEEMFSEFQKLCDKLFTISHKVMNEFARNFKLRRLFGFHPYTEELIIKDILKKNDFPVIRFDTFFQNGKIKLCEINSEGAAGYRKDILTNKNLLEMSFFKSLSKQFDLSYKNLCEECVSIILSKYENCKKHFSKPTVAIACYKDTHNYYDAELLCKEFNDRGITAYIADPRDFEYINDCLYYEKVKIDIVYNASLIKYIIDCRDSRRPFFNATLNSDIMNIGCYKGFVINDKSFFAAVFTDLVQNILNSEEKSIVNEYFPFTQFFRGNRKLLADVSLNKDKYILKTKNTFGGIGVFPGKNYTGDEWDKLTKNAWNKQYIIQEFIETDTDIYPYIKNGMLEYDNFRITVGLFCFCEKLAGLYSRASKENIINAEGENDYYLGNILIGRM